VSSLGDGPTRRTFLKVMGASVGLAGAASCAPPDEEILPYARQPLEAKPGVTVRYATALMLDGLATGALVRCRDGRPIKVDGNPGHPASLGGAGVFEQAAILSLYDPDRAMRPRGGRRVATWEQCVRAIRAGLGHDGGGAHLILEPTSSATTLRLLARVRERIPRLSMYWDSLEPPSPQVRQYDLARTRVVLAIDADPLASGPFHLRYARHFAQARRVGDDMARLYVAEPTPTPTGTMADHRLPLRAADAAALLAEVLLALPAQSVSAPVREALTRIAGERRHGPWAAVVARDLAANRGRGATLVGARQPRITHAMAHLLDSALGNIGATTWFTRSALLAGAESDGIAQLATAIESGGCHTLIVAGANPAYSAPADLDFTRLMRKAGLVATLSGYEDETAEASSWFMPMAHPLESWGDGRALDGVASVVQPVIRPMHGGRTVDELLAALMGENADGLALVRETWQAEARPDAWTRALEQGVVEGTAERRIEVPVPTAEIIESGAKTMRPPALELVFRTDSKVHDGRFANNAWLQELPDPVTKLTWDNAALLSPKTAARIGIQTGQHVALTSFGRTLAVPALIVPGHADESIVLSLGYGRTGELSVAQGAGVNAGLLRTRSAPSIADVTAVPGPGPTHHFAVTQTHWSIEGRDHVRHATLEELRHNPDLTSDQRGPVPSLYPPIHTTAPNQWAMLIDLSLCTGCSACVVSCQAENNVPVVGADGVRDSREMHWLRIDRYLEGPPDNPEASIQPMLCQHCEKAPCEYVCPVNATVHSSDGLNEMVYNRCVGTRFCSNNCPYKVRRFNWFNYESHIAETLKLAHNPEVTVRERGVMEKCTFCVQRIRGAQVVAGREQRSLHPDEVRTACQEACPSQAISFGSLTDPTPELAAGLADRRRYSVLHELGTRPRVQYLARITNPNPAMASQP
jgi:molybdopterin-containing oxidoreductase family iron-sulfur binding subunit